MWRMRHKVWHEGLYVYLEKILPGHLVHILTSYLKNGHFYVKHES